MPNANQHFHAVVQIKMAAAQKQTGLALLFR